MISHFSKALAQKQATSYPGPGPGVHISTYPLKLAAVAEKKKEEADSGSAFPQVLRPQKDCE